MMELMHYATKPVAFDRQRKYEQRQPCGYRKPEGFWVSVAGDDDWPSWCRSEECFIDSIQVAHEVKLAPTATILYLGSLEEMDAFHDSYTVETESERTSSVCTRKDWPIDWRAVAASYDGIIIAPYQWRRRLEYTWYYGWDCASGCIWETAAIDSVSPVTAEVV